MKKYPDSNFSKLSKKIVEKLKNGKDNILGILKKYGEKHNYNTDKQDPELRLDRNVDKPIKFNIVYELKNDTNLWYWALCGDSKNSLKNWKEHAFKVIENEESIRKKYVTKQNLEKIVSEIDKESQPNKKQDIIRNFLIKKWINKKCSDSIKYFTDTLNWTDIQNAIKKLQNITWYCIPFDQIKIKLASFPMLPERPNEDVFNIWFWFSKNIKTTVLHECLHFIFFKHFDYLLEKEALFKNEKKNLWKNYGKNFERLKEAMTIILASEFEDFYEDYDNPYPDHQEFRKALKQERDQNKNFDKLIKFWIQYLKDNPIK